MRARTRETAVEWCILEYSAALPECSKSPQGVRVERIEPLVGHRAAGDPGSVNEWVLDSPAEPSRESRRSPTAGAPMSSSSVRVLPSHVTVGLTALADAV